jgi:hypothetical protein
MSKLEDKLTLLHPITFSIPESKILIDIPNKTKILSTIIPGINHDYKFTNENDYYNEYKDSMFATTRKKAGWDCMRHYEIMANRCIPYFIDLEKCPLNTMALLPKDLLLEGNILYNKISKTATPTYDNMREYNILNNKLTRYLRDNLTTKCIANYILEKISIKNPSKILFLSGCIKPDYLRCLTLHGFKEKFGRNCHDYPKVSHLYISNTIDYSKLYGMGMTYTNLLESTLHDDILNNTIEDDIKSKKYDIIIYGSFHRGTPYYNLVSKIYKSNEIIMLCGEDIHKCSNRDFYLSMGHHMFVREL